MAGAGASDVLLSYNGKRFDIPLLSTRNRLSRLADPYVDMPHVDLLYPVRRLFGTNWPDCRLKTVEERLLGLYREDDLPGSMAPVAWSQWVRHGMSGLLPRVFKHNRLDLLSLGVLPVVLARLLAESVQDAGQAQGLREAHASPLAVARLLRQQNRDTEAYQLLCSSSCSNRLGARGRLELARQHCLHGNMDEAVKEWELLVARGCEEAMVRLAIHKEHRTGDLPGAAALTGVMIRLHGPKPEHLHRQERLARKLTSKVDP